MKRKRKEIGENDQKPKVISQGIQSSKVIMTKQKLSRKYSSQRATLLWGRENKILAGSFKKDLWQ